MATAYCYTMESPRSAFDHPETVEHTRDIMLRQMREGARNINLDLASEHSLIWFPPQFLVLLFGEDENGEEMIHRIVAQSAEEATHIRLTCEAVYDPAGL